MEDYSCGLRKFYYRRMNRDICKLRFSEFSKSLKRGQTTTEAISSADYIEIKYLNEIVSLEVGLKKLETLDRWWK